MERVYIELKARAMRGEFAPGERLDPAVLARNLEVSATPVRDALHRLSGACLRSSGSVAISIDHPRILTADAQRASVIVQSVCVARDATSITTAQAGHLDGE